MAEIYSLYLMELLMQANGTLPFEEAWRYFLMRFSHMWDNFIDFESFVHSQPMLFDVVNNFIFLKSSQVVDRFVFIPTNFNSTFPLNRIHIDPSPAPSRPLQPQDFAAEAEAVNYFKRQIERRMETWISIKSLAGHLSQASTSIRAVVGPQSNFARFLLRHPRIFAVQGDLVSLCDEMKLDFTLHQGSQVRQNGSKRNRPLSMYSRLGPCPPSQDGINETECLNIDWLSSQSMQNLPQQSQLSELQPSSETILISPADYAAAMWLRQAVKKLSGNNDCGVPLADLMKEFVCAPVKILNSVGLTQIEVIEFLKKFKQLFEVDQKMCKNRFLDKASITFIASESTNADNKIISLVNKKGVAYCICKSWGIIDLGQHEHVFFDRSLFKHVENLTNHFAVGETLCFNAILAPKESRAKWRATHVWKETDILAVQLSELALTPSLASQSCDNSTTPSEGNSDSGVQDATVQKHSFSSTSAGVESLLSNSEFNITRLDGVGTNKLLDLQEPVGLDNSDDEVGNPQNNGRIIRGGTKGLKYLAPSGDIMGGDQSDDNTMSDVPSISSCLPVSVTSGRYASSCTQTYFTGEILSKKVCPEILNCEQHQ